MHSSVWQKSIFGGWGTESQVAHKRAGWPRNPCRLGGPQRFRAGDRFCRGPAHKWAGCLHNPYCWVFTPASERGTKSEVAHKWVGWLHNPYRLGGPQRFKRGSEVAVAHKWAGGYISPAALRVPNASRRTPPSGKGYVATGPIWGGAPP